MTIKKLEMLDLFCCAGGAGMGYSRAGFEITCVDIQSQPNNPHTFIKADAFEYLSMYGSELDAIYASPPCQGYSTLESMHRDKEYPLLIKPLRDLLKNTGRPM